MSAENELSSPIAISDVTGLQSALDTKLESATNVGAGVNVFKDIVALVLRFRTILGLGRISASLNGDTVEVSTTAELNTLSNQVADTASIKGLATTKVLEDLRIRNLEAGTNITLTSSANTVKIDASGGGSASITEVEIDLGTTPVYEGDINIVDAGVSTTSQILAQVLYKAPTGKDLDEIEMDNFNLKCEPLAGSFNLKIRSEDGSYLADRFLIGYLVG